ncbi:ferrous iron transport protein A [Deinococcus sp. Marseille-Q6407]|uniref:FeoA family protein n=1 Tax=Deinococcus sp. Marseille-Q6407 TaxID=2969223 RepID=UPI0021C224AB|nr:ferrous iron transport protein A [Deinococcus sp. Marseille-Q6407]
MTRQTAAQLPAGQPAHVVGIDRSHPLRRRLLELGCIRGAPIRVLRAAPGGDPVELRLGGTDLALRRADLQAIEVSW